MDTYFFVITARFHPFSTGDWAYDPRPGFRDRIAGALAQEFRAVEDDVTGNLRAWRADVCDPASPLVTVMGVIGPIESTGGDSGEGYSITDYLGLATSDAGAISARVDVHPVFPDCAARVECQSALLH
ncbi:hypothetical protein [Nocardioides salarius]|uniref:hypothetical protein n=1 Tax=Nocardioides salarius TaxID=374513 RepID=UPI0030F88B9C